MVDTCSNIDLKGRKKNVHYIHVYTYIIHMYRPTHIYRKRHRDGDRQRQRVYTEFHWFFTIFTTTATKF